MARLFLVRHGLSTMDRDLPAHEWGLDPAGLPGIEALRDSGRLPRQAVWFSSPETKAFATARSLTQSPVTVVDALREHERHSTQWAEDFAGTVRRAFASADVPAMPGWEPLAVTRERLLPAVRRILADHPEQDVVLVGHGTAWTLLKAELTGEEPDLEAWAALEMPDLWVVDQPAGRHPKWLP